MELGLIRRVLLGDGQEGGVPAQHQVLGGHGDAALAHCMVLGHARRAGGGLPLLVQQHLVVRVAQHCRVVAPGAAVALALHEGGAAGAARQRHPHARGAAQGVNVVVRGGDGVRVVEGEGHRHAVAVDGVGAAGAEAVALAARVIVGDCTGEDDEVGPGGGAVLGLDGLQNLDGLIQVHIHGQVLEGGEADTSSIAPPGIVSGSEGSSALVCQGGEDGGVGGLASSVHVGGQGG
mmetsp:Transcript_10473/g.22481  ORF Transcript_10473/g.22481 Transcript_10473/m.22481 type:complete len:234 (+) Transcript_10473:49-750(+)